MSRAVAGTAFVCASFMLAGEVFAARPPLPALDVQFAESRALVLPADVPARRQARRDIASAASPHGYPSEFDAALGVPAFLWVNGAAAPAPLPLQRRALIEAWGRQHLASHSVALGLTAATIADAALIDIHDLGRGALIARFEQRASSLPVFGRRLAVTMKPDGTPVAISGYFAVDAASVPAGEAKFPIAAASAIALARAQVASAEAALVSPPRTWQVLYPHPLSLEPAWLVEVVAREPSGETRAYALVLSAATGRTLYRDNLSRNFSYRVFADASGNRQPFDSALGNGYLPFPGKGPGEALHRIGVPSELVTLDHGPIPTGDPWLPAGATLTKGNNVDAYLDVGVGSVRAVSQTNAYYEGTGDKRATATSDGVFDYPIAADADPSTPDAQYAANVNLFFVTNWLHDLWYAHGFDEPAGNAQVSNYGRGGAEGDPLQAQAQDSSGRNDVEMMVPVADGSSPILQAYLWDGSVAGSVALGGGGEPAALSFVAANFGPSTYEVSGPAAPADETLDVAGDGCAAPTLAESQAAPAPPQPSLNGAIAILKRNRDCAYTAQARYAQASGAVAAVIVFDRDDLPQRRLEDFTVNGKGAGNDTISIPTVMISRSDGERLNLAIKSGSPVTISLVRDHAREHDRDPSFDTTIVAHEYFHFVSLRLTAAGLGNNQGYGLGEGWSDFVSVLQTLKPGDSDGAVALGYYMADDDYFGVRRVPYSLDFGRNALTLRHIADGEPLPAGVPTRIGDDPNSEPHNTGEVWATMLLECHAGVVALRRASFDDARARMQDYLIAGLKATPPTPTIVEARDAILAAALASDAGDYEACARGFSRRGAGPAAIAPPRDSADNTGVTEDFSTATAAPRSGHDPITGGGLGFSLLPLALAGLRRRFRIQEMPRSGGVSPGK